MKTKLETNHAIDIEGRVFCSVEGTYTGEKVISINGKVFRFLCDTCCSVFQSPLGYFDILNNGSIRPICKFCAKVGA